MVLQPLLKVSILDAFVNGSGAGIDLDLMWWELRPQTAPPSAKLWQDLRLRKVIIHVYKDVLSSHLSSGGPLPFCKLAL